MLRFAAELKQPAILYGGRECYRPEAAALLKKSNAPVLVSLQWPETAARRATPTTTRRLRTLETRDKAPAAPAAAAEGRREVRALLRRPGHSRATSSAP